MHSFWLAVHGGGHCSGLVGRIACVGRMFRMPAAAGASLAPHGCYSRSLDARRCSINPTDPTRAPGGHVRTCIDVKLTEHASGRIAVGQHNTCGLRQRRLRAWRCVCIVWCIGTDGSRGSDGRSCCGRPEERLLCVWRPRWRLSRVVATLASGRNVSNVRRVETTFFCATVRARIGLTISYITKLHVTLIRPFTRFRSGRARRTRARARRPLALPAASRCRSPRFVHPADPHARHCLPASSWRTRAAPSTAPVGQNRGRA